jgi:cobalt-zinc-cadmium efflux system protein
MGHAHGESAMGRNRQRLAIVLALTSLYLIAQVVGGLLTGSLALLADAGHMLTDVAGLALALLASKIAETPASPRRTYGYYRVEILAAALNALLLIGVAMFVMYEAYARVQAPPAIASGPMLAIGAGGFAVNLAGAFILRSAADESLNMRGAYIEVISDLITSVGVMAGAILMWITDWYLIDPLISFGIALFILPRTWSLLREAVNVLLEGTPADLNLAEVRATMTATPGVASVHDLHAWSITSGINALSAHVVLGSGSDHVVVRQALHARLTTAFKLQHLTLQMEQRDEPHDEPHL